MEDLNKITSTKVGDNIHFFVNGAEDKGTVVKMDSKFVTVVKDDGNFQDIHINDTFFIKDILVNKSWNDMTMEERTVELHKVHAYSPRFLGKAWDELPTELKDVMLENSNKDAQTGKQSITGKPRDRKTIPTPFGVIPEPEESQTRTGSESRSSGTQPRDEPLIKSNVEQGHLGGGGRSGHAVETSTAFDAEEDYEGESHDTKEEQFKHDKEKPKVTEKSSRAARGGNMNSGTTLRPSDITDLQNLDGSENTQATPTSETKYFGAGGKRITREEHEKTKTYGSMQEQLWEQWLDKDGGMGGGSPPASTSSNSSAQTNDSGMYNPVYGDKGRHGGQGRDKEEEDKEEDKERKG